MILLRIHNPASGIDIPVVVVYPRPVSDVTRILDRVQQGEGNAAEELLPLVYEELRKLAAHKMAHEAPGQTLQPTALVHEAWLKLAGAGRDQYAGRVHFFAAAAEAMRQILIDKARRKAALKRGGDCTIEELHESRIELRAPSDELLAVHEALDQLAAEDPLAAEVVKLRYFVGMTISEVAEALQIAPRTADRHWLFARAWLKRAIRSDTPA
jgi:RNA polymerase sigma factor (TIGR02999 family)